MAVRSHTRGAGGRRAKVLRHRAFDFSLAEHWVTIPRRQPMRVYSAISELLTEAIARRPRSADPWSHGAESWSNARLRCVKTVAQEAVATGK